MKKEGSKMTTHDLEARVKRLEDLEAIRRLRYTYCYLCDEYKMDELLKLFAKGAQCDFHEFGQYVGNEEVAKFYKEIVPTAMTFFVHMVHNPMIEIIDENNAKGKWYADVPATLSGEARWMCGRYEEQYVKEDGVWKFKEINFFWYYETPIDQGWVKERMKL